MCNCIANSNKTLAETYRDPEASIECTYSFNVDRFFSKPHGICMKYRKRKKDGTFASRKTSVPIIPTFCPFCGKKYFEET